jgi:hypothetical protein
MGNVFNQEGFLVPDPSIDCIRAIRQICLFGKKLKRTCSQARLRGAVDKFRECDDELTVMPPGQLSRWFELTAAVICRSLNLNNLDISGRIKPRHGPGATEDRISGNQKWIFRRWHRRLEDVGFTHTLFGNHLAMKADDLDVGPLLVEPEDEKPVKVTLVPKTLKTPRVIAIEPVCMQYAQQGLKRLLVKALFKGRLTRGHVNFRDQSVNQQLALRSSRDGFYATVDMSEASDRVSLSHVETAFAAAPVFRSWLLATRSTRARLPDGQVIDLKKFASMGSATCFPVEAMVFFTSIIASRLHRAGIFPTTRSVLSLGRDVFVYGDDLIFPAHEAAAICDDLESLGFRVNRRKSFWTGRFRESCGADCYDGEEVTPVYLRSDIPANRSDVSGIVSSVSTVNQLEKAGLWSTAAVLRQAVERIIGSLPLVPLDSPGIGWHDHSIVEPRRRWNRLLQRGEIRAWVMVPVKRKDLIEGQAAFTKVFSGLVGKSVYRNWWSLTPNKDRRHLEMSTKRRAFTLKRDWVPAR